MLFVRSSGDLSGFFSWQHRDDYTCVGLREKTVTPAVGVGSIDSKRDSDGCAGDAFFTLCCQQTRFRQGQNFLTSTARIDVARDSRCLVIFRRIHQTRSQAFEQMGEFPLPLVWAFGGQNTRGGSSPPAQSSHESLRC